MADFAKLFSEPESSSTKMPEPGHALTPPTSVEGNKRDNTPEDICSDFDLNDEELGDIEPAFYYEGGKIPVFKPTMQQFRSFSKFISKINNYGMKAGIIKVIPPEEWRNNLPNLNEAVKSIKIKNPISQDFAGTHGTYTQANIEKQRSYNLPQWKALAEEPQHQPPAKRGERRQGQPRQIVAPRQKRTPTEASNLCGHSTARKGPGRPRKYPRIQSERTKAHTPMSGEMKQNDITSSEDRSNDTTVDHISVESMESQTPPLTHDNPGLISTEHRHKHCSGGQTNSAEPFTTRAKGQSKSVSERRKYNQKETAEKIDESAFENFDYRIHNQDEYTPERCAELETAYWKSLTFASPMYAADMPGSLFPDSTTSWNVAKLDNLLDVIGQKVPGVNTAYLYLGMWKATFAWHLEDVDLYSINYIHFGAPKQWYSISQEDARRFESAMKSIWPSDAKNCSQFLRHKTYLVSPSLLQNQFNIRVNKLVHYEGEFVITFPYGYHSGYNIGYNCAESVNFATEDWLEYGKIAKKCNCEADSVWIDAHYIERKLRGEPTPEYYEETDDDESLEQTELPSPPASIKGAAKSGSKRKRESAACTLRDKKIRVRVKKALFEPCVLCPNNPLDTELLPTDNGRRAHVVCAEYTPETYIWVLNGVRTICDVEKIGKARLDLKCSFCRSKKGACVQCSQKKCTRAFHATCAAPAGVRVDSGRTPQYLPDDSTEYYVEDNDFRCRFHRSKRPKSHDSALLEKQSSVYRHAASVEVGAIVQIQLHGGDIFAGLVQENRSSEQAVVVKILPNGDVFEVDWKWILTHDEADSQLPKASSTAKPLPADIDKDLVQTHNDNGPPRPDDLFCSPSSSYRWQEYHCGPSPQNMNQASIDLSSPDKLWYYLGPLSTHTFDRYTESFHKPCANPASNFLASVAPSPTSKANGSQRDKKSSNQAIGTQQRYRQTTQIATVAAKSQGQNQIVSDGSNRPYVYKPKPEISAPHTSLIMKPNTHASMRTNLPNLAKGDLENSRTMNQHLKGTDLGTNPNDALQSHETLPSMPAATSPTNTGRVYSLPQQARRLELNHQQSIGFDKLDQPAHVASLLGVDGAHVSRASKYQYLLSSLFKKTAYVSPYDKEGGYSPDWLRQDTISFFPMTMEESNPFKHRISAGPADSLDMISSDISSSSQAVGTEVAHTQQDDAPEDMSNTVAISHSPPRPPVSPIA